MQRDAAMGRQGLKELTHQFGIELADLGGGKGKVPGKPRPPGEIKCHSHLGIVHRSAEHSP